MSLMYLLIVTVYVLNCVRDVRTQVGGLPSKCQHTEKTNVEAYEVIADQINIPTDEDIGKGENISGMQPMQYELRLTFQNRTHYSGAASIWMTVVEPTKYLMVNVKRNSPKLDYKGITVSVKLEVDVSQEICINRFIYITEFEILVMELDRVLHTHLECLVTFNSFTSFAFDKETETGAEGLLLSSSNDHNALHTLFQEKLARSVFPCMDHPALKATFKLWIDVPTNFKVASNTQLDDKGYQLTGTKLTRNSFKETPKMSTYLFAFAVMHNYLELDNLKCPKFGVWAPSKNSFKLLWTLPKAQQAFDYIQSMILPNLPLERINLLFVDGLPIGGMENFGLISLNRERMEASNSEKAIGVVFHEVAHQWIGNVVTVRNWNELCLQEALASYMERILMEKFAGVTVFQWVRDIVRRYVYRKYNSLLGERTKNTEQLDCYDRGPVIFHMIAQMYGSKSIESFVSNIVYGYTYKNAGLDEWDSVLGNVLANRSIVKGYLRSWFAEPGPLTLHIRLDDDSNVEINQHLADSIHPAKPTLLKVYLSASAEPVRVIFNSLLYNIPLQDSSWLLVDPDSQTLTQKIYTSKLYQQVFATTKSDYHNHLTDERVKAAADEFCRHVLDGSLPLSNDRKRSDWISVLALVLKINELDDRCACCITDPKLRFDNCLKHSDGCDRLRLTRMLFFPEPVSAPL